MDTERGTAAVSVQNQLGMRYELAPSLSITPVFDFEYLLQGPDGSAPSEKLALSYDSFLKLYATDVFEAKGHDGTLAMDAELRAFVPTSKASRDNGTIGSLRAAVYPALRFEDSNFWVSSAANVRYWFQTRDTWADGSGAKLQRVNVYGGPQLNYRISESVVAWFLYEAYAALDVSGHPNTRDPSISHTDIEPGVDIFLSRRFVVTPYLNWYLNQHISTVSINLNASVTL